MFKAVLIEKDDEGYRAALKAVDESVLPEGDVTIKVSHSTLNYKDGLAITGKSPVVRSFPMIPGIDLVGEVTECTSGKFNPGDKVLLNGFGVGEVHCGGLAEVARLKSDWLIPLPKGFTAAQAMAVGTAGYTAMLCVIALEKQGVYPADGPVLVTGANGGVGSFAISLLTKLGYTVAASTGRMNEADYLKKLGASEIIDRATLSEKGRPLGKEIWAGAVDTVGSQTLANVCSQIKYGGAVAACGLAGGFDLPATVMPFILRGVTLAGVDSVMRPLEDRTEAWSRLAELIDESVLDAIAVTIPLEKAIETAGALLDGKVRGRIVVEI
jgi:acrylyl-CoA reductase (NADPH)